MLSSLHFILALPRLDIAGVSFRALIGPFDYAVPSFPYVKLSD